MAIQMMTIQGLNDGDDYRWCEEPCCSDEDPEPADIVLEELRESDRCPFCCGTVAYDWSRADMTFAYDPGDWDNPPSGEALMECDSFDRVIICCAGLETFLRFAGRQVDALEDQAERWLDGHYRAWISDGAYRMNPGRFGYRTS